MRAGVAAHSRRTACRAPVVRGVLFAYAEPGWKDVGCDRVRGKERARPEGILEGISEGILGEILEGITRPEGISSHRRRRR